MSSKTLFHYTTFEGLKGILGEDCFRATDAYTTNDFQEIVHGIELINHYISESIESDEVINKKVMEFTDYLIGKERFDKLARGVFLTCFSSYDADKSSYDFNNGLLSQWRGYGLKQGYMLKFDTDVLLKDFVNKDREDIKGAAHVYGDVAYCNRKDFFNNQDNKKSFDEILKSIGQLKASPSEFNGSQKEQELFESILSISFCNKHEGFREEREYRVATAIWRDEKNERKYNVFFFEGYGGVIRSYVRVLEGKPRMALREIVVGPSSNKERNKIQIESFLKKIGVVADVKISATPFV
ncbi:MAG: DUF2971 domain-containing protein [Pseudomonadota bacterium]